MFELGSAWMLGWLAAAGIPLALHLLHRRRQQEIPWAAMELLLQAIRQNSRTVRIEQWLLLLLRTCALILFATALARPLMRGSAETETVVSLPPKLWVLVLDASYSMTYKPQQQSLWELAQQRAGTLIRQAQSGDAFILLQMGEPSSAVIAQPAFEPARVIEELQRLKCSDAGADLPSCLQLVKQMLDDAKQSAPEHDDVQIVFYTDLGRDTWQSAINGAERRTLQELASQHSVRVESLAAESPANVAITAFETDAPLVLRGRTLRSSVTVQNFGTSDLQRLPIQFQSEGSTLHTEFVDCPAGGSRTVVAEIQPPPTRYWNLSVAIPEDRLAIDNRRDMIVSVRPQVHVITVEETPGAAKLINLSLAPHANVSDIHAPLAVETWNIGELSTRSLSAIDAVVLVDPTELNANAIDKLRSFVERGGAVLALLGPHARTSSWNRSNNSAGELFGFDLNEPAPDGDWRVDPLNYASPIAKPFANFQDAGLLTTPVFRYWRVAPREQSDLQIDLGFTSGDPWLVRRSSGSGWFAALLSAPQSGTAAATGLTSGSSTEDVWNAMATWPSFVPIMQKIIETIIGGSEQAMNLDVGQPLRGFSSITGRARPTELTVRRPDNTTSRLTIAPVAEDNRQAWIYAATDRAGVYHVSIDQAAEGDGDLSVERPFAVNIVPTQSELQSISAASLPLSKANASGDSRRPTVRPSANTGQSESLARWCLIALFGVLACESVLAWNLGRRLT